MHDYKTCNTFRMRFKGEQLRMSHYLLLNLRKDFHAEEIRFVPRSMQVFVICFSRFV